MFALVVGLLPVLLFLGTLVLLDSYKLVTRGSVVRSLMLGWITAVAAWALHWVLIERAGVPPILIKRWIAPLLEELLKAAPILFLIRRGQIGFLVDAAIHGFALGTGFAVVENVYYAGSLSSAGLAVWVARGLGTAVMHGGATALVAVIARDLSERHESTALRWLVPGLLPAFALHAAYNHLLLPPLVESAIVMLVVPLILVLVFERSERATRDWLGHGVDHDVGLLELIHSGALENTHVGRYLDEVRTRFPATVVSDMLCYLELHLELAMKAKGLLIARGAGVEMPADPELPGRFAELRYLERSIGRTGMLALLPFLHERARDRWQLAMLEKRQPGH